MANQKTSRNSGAGDALGGGTFTIGRHVHSAPALAGGLYLVSTPIGNLGDITVRALETLAASDVIACEDTRTSGVLLSRYGIDRPKVSYNEHNASTRGPDLVRQLGEGRAIALISDAGTPLVSDPGLRLVADAIEAGAAVVPVPGASAPLAAFAGSGFANVSFQFAGFLPSKSGARMTALQKLASNPATLIFFESPNRLPATLSAMAEIFGPDRRACVARELTKMHETFHRGTLRELTEEFAGGTRIRGEIVIVVDGAREQKTVGLDADEILTALLAELPAGKAASEAARRTGRSRQELYDRALELKRGK